MVSPRDLETVRAQRRPGDPLSVAAIAADPEARSVVRERIRHATRVGYSYNFTWLGTPIIQRPEDIVVVPELIWQGKPDLVSETGIAHGGSLVFGEHPAPAWQ